MACATIDDTLQLNHVKYVESRMIGKGIGKGLFALKNFKKGDRIFEENPLVCCQFVHNKEYGYLACEYCMKPLESAERNVQRLLNNFEISLPHPELCDSVNITPVNCSNCNESYCSKLCKNTAWNKYHKTLCINSLVKDEHHPLLMLQNEWKSCHYPPETSSIMLQAQMIAVIRQSENKEEMINIFMDFFHQTTNEDGKIHHKMMGEQFEKQIETLRSLMEKAMGTEDVKLWLTMDGFRSLLALVGTNGQGIGTSSFSKWLRNCEKHKEEQFKNNPAEEEAWDLFLENIYEKLDDRVGSFLDNEGSGLFRYQSKCNHSCTPNAEVTFPCNNFHLVMVALKDIKEGEEIYISYVEKHILKKSRHSRQKMFRDFYMFTCTCDKCNSQVDDADVTSSESSDCCSDEEIDLEEDENGS